MAAALQGTMAGVQILATAADLPRLDPVEPAPALRIILSKALQSVDPRALEWITRRRCALVACASGKVAGLPLAAALFSDYLAVEESASLEWGKSSEELAGLAWRIGRRALPLLLRQAFPMPAAVALESGISDEVVAAGTDWVKWSKEWIGARSELAIQSAARLIRLRGGDELERSEFARLFAAGEPQRGLRAFLDKRRPDFDRDEGEG
jgi:enoyl-CoA hydratase/carnithine racemase